LVTKSLKKFGHIRFTKVRIDLNVQRTLTSQNSHFIHLNLKTQNSHFSIGQQSTHFCTIDQTYKRKPFCFSKHKTLHIIFEAHINANSITSTENKDINDFVLANPKLSASSMMSVSMPTRLLA